jgi:hypothetical protein
MRKIIKALVKYGDLFSYHPTHFTIHVSTWVGRREGLVWGEVGEDLP